MEREVDTLAKVDPQIYEINQKEVERIESRILLIASENLASKAVIEAGCSVLTNKYAEGYPDHRYYGGCEHVDSAEKLAIERAREIFGAEHINVQPHSGSQANMAVYFAVLKPGDMIMGMSLAHGGHLTHGAKVSFSGKLYQTCYYGVDQQTELIDYDAVRKLAHECKPKMIVCGASAYPRIIDFAEFGKIAREVGAYLMVDIAHIAGLVVSGDHPSPVPHAEFVTTTTHKTLRGPRGGLTMCRQEFAKAIDKTIFPGIQGGPLMHTIAAKAVAFKEASQQKFKDDQRQTILNAQKLGAELMARGFHLVSGGTDNHLMLVNLTNKNITGKEADARLDRAGITLNKNAVPFDPLPPAVTSGIRIGTPTVTTRGMKEPEMVFIAERIDRVLSQSEVSDELLAQTREEVRQLCAKFPFYRK